MRKLLMMLALAAIGLSAIQCTNTQQEKKKPLVAYFSATGITRAAAEQLAELSGADIYEIEPETLYTDADLDWRDSLSRSFIEMHDKTSRPAIKGTATDLADYEVIYIGFPIWWNAAPTIINTFIEAHDLTGKTLIPFATSGSSSIDNSCEELRQTYPTLTWGEGYRINDLDEDAIKEWIAQ